MIMNDSELLRMKMKRERSERFNFAISEWPTRFNLKIENLEKEEDFFQY
jgi:hypothetical protein